MSGIFTPIPPHFFYPSGKGDGSSAIIRKGLNYLLIEKDLFPWYTEEPGYAECKTKGRHVPVFFDSDDGLTWHSDLQGEIFLREGSDK